MKTALTVLATVILTAIAILAGEQSWLLPFGNNVDICSTNPEKCRLPMGESCTTPRQKTIPHGESVLSFAGPTGDVQNSCVSKTSTCNNGNWLEDIVPYEYARCEIEVTKGCEVNGTTLVHGSAKVFYDSGVLVNGQWTCGSQERACTNWTINGDEQYIYTTCETKAVENNQPEPVVVAPVPVVSPPIPTVNELPQNTQADATASETESTSTEEKPFNCPSPWGGPVWEPNRSQMVYLESAALEGETCESTMVVCAYGSIRYGTPENIWDVVQVSLYPTCGVREPAACTAPGDIQIAHGGSLTLYQSAEVQALPWDGSDTCVRQRRECGNGTWYDYNGAPADFTFQYTSCTVLPPPAGDGVGGEGIPQ